MSLQHIVDFDKLLGVLERIAVALEAQVKPKVDSTMYDSKTITELERDADLAWVNHPTHWWNKQIPQRCVYCGALSRSTTAAYPCDRLNVPEQQGE